MRARGLLIISAVLAWLVGLILMFDSRGFEAPAGINVTDKVATIAQAQGAILVGLGLINWMTRNVVDLRALAAVLAGNLVVQIASLAVVLHALVLHILPVKEAPAAVIHVLLGAAFAAYLLRARRATTAAGAT